MADLAHLFLLVPLILGFYNLIVGLLTFIGSLGGFHGFLGLLGFFGYPPLLTVSLVSHLSFWLPFLLDFILH